MSKRTSRRNFFANLAAIPVVATAVSTVNSVATANNEVTTDESHDDDLRVDIEIRTTGKVKVYYDDENFAGSALVFKSLEGDMVFTGGQEDSIMKPIKCKRLDLFGEKFICDELGNDIVKMHYIANNHFKTLSYFE